MAVFFLIFCFLGIDYSQFLPEGKMMSLEKVKALEDKYPFFRPFWGVECGDGWFGIIDELCGKFSEMNLKGAKIEFIKEKFAGLRVGLSHFGGMNYEVILLAIDSAHERSLETCEECGKAGTTRSIGGWLKTLCDECSARKGGTTVGSE
jgi:hypothetical protein